MKSSEAELVFKEYQDSERILDTEGNLVGLIYKAKDKVFLREPRNYTKAQLLAIAQRLTTEPESIA